MCIHIQISSAHTVWHHTLFFQHKKRFFQIDLHLQHVELDERSIVIIKRDNDRPKPDKMNLQYVIDFETCSTRVDTCE